MESVCVCVYVDVFGTGISGCPRWPAVSRQKGVSRCSVIRPANESVYRFAPGQQRAHVLPSATESALLTVDLSTGTHNKNRDICTHLALAVHSDRLSNTHLLSGVDGRLYKRYHTVTQLPTQRKSSYIYTQGIHTKRISSAKISPKQTGREARRRNGELRVHRQRFLQEEGEPARCRPELPYLQELPLSSITLPPHTPPPLSQPFCLPCSPTRNWIPTPH